MIVVDTNYFLRAMLGPVTDNDRDMTVQAEYLFRHSDVLPFTTTDSIIAEIIFVLDQKYGLGRAHIAGRIRPLLSLEGCRLATKSACLAAMDLWELQPKLSFVDAMVIAQARQTDSPLGTFDRYVARTAGVEIWEPPQTSNGK